MSKIIGIRREDKSHWERRVPLIPEDIKKLIDEHNIKVLLQPSHIRAFPDKDYIEAGAEVKEDISEASLVFAVKEIPLDFFSPNKTYIFFSHTIKGQTNNMDMLKRMMELECQLIDYEKIADKNGRRLIFFGRYAGIAGMIDTLWALGKRLKWEGVKNPFTQIKRAYEYREIKGAKDHITQVGKEIIRKGLNDTFLPLLFVFTGYGNVSGGAQEILDCLPVKKIRPFEIINLFRDGSSEKVIYKAVFKEGDMVEHISGEVFDLMNYYAHPSKYCSRFHNYIPYITVLMNCIYWEAKYPRLVTKANLKRHFRMGATRLRVIGDISCDIEGAVECTIHSTTPDKPVFVYDPVSETSKDGYKGKGPVIMAIDNLPCEIPVESSIYFSETLMKFVPDIIKADFSKSFEGCNLPDELKNGVILYKGKLTEKYKYLEKYL